MNIIYLLAPLALLLGITFAIGFLLAASSGQYDDMETPAYKILIDDRLDSELKTTDRSKGQTP